MKLTVIAMGTLSQKMYSEAFAEYAKRFTCGFECIELKEKRLSQDPSEAQIAAALDAEAEAILSKIPSRAFAVAMAIEGKTISSEELASLIENKTSSGTSDFCFIVGSSFGLSDKVKRRADMLISMSKMTFPHQLARVMLAEQLYRATQIISGKKYHK